MPPLFDSDFVPIDKELVALCEEPGFERIEFFLEELWACYKPFADEHFRREIVSQFHNRFWEMYLACALMEQDFRIVSIPRTARPDVCLEWGERHIWIEAIAPGPGQGVDAVPQRNGSDRARFRRVPEENVLLRYRSAIEAKLSQYVEYLEHRLISPVDPYVIAMNGRKVPYSWDFEFPRFIKAVLPVGPSTADIDWEKAEAVSGGYLYRSKIHKASGSSVSTDIFLTEDYAGVSGLLFSRVDALRASEELGEDFKFFHNPVATNPLPKGWIRVGREYWLEGNTLRTSIWRN